MTTKVVKLEIIKPINTTWKLFGDILYKIQRETREMLNRTMQLCWEFNGFASDYKIEYGSYPNDKDVFNKTLAGFIYDRLKGSTIMYSANSSQSQQRALKKWKETSKKIFTGEVSIPNYRRGVPIDLHNKSINATKNESGYVLKLKLLNRQGVKDFGLEKSEIDVVVIAKDSSAKAILDRVISGEYKIGGSQIIKHKHKNKWFINLTYSFEPEKNNQLDEDSIMGIDMGICNPVYIAYNNSYKRFQIEGDEIASFKKKVFHRRNSMLKQGKYCGGGRQGHGIKTKIKPIEKLESRVENFKQTTNHKYSKKIIELAIKNGCGTIQMENLEGIAADEKKATFLGSWPYYDLQTKIEYKANEAGIKVIKVDPKYTSQRCSKCGYIHTDNRPKKEKGQGYFKCIFCEYETHADYNAARNIATKNIEAIIVEQLKKQQMEHDNALKYLL